MLPESSINKLRYPILDEASKTLTADAVLAYEAEILDEAYELLKAYEAERAYEALIALSAFRACEALVAVNAYEAERA